jgi:hypothetical protein
MLHKIRNAAPECRTHCKGHRALEDVLRPNIVAWWRKEVQAWEANWSLPSPFAPKLCGLFRCCIMNCALI